MTCCPPPPEVDVDGPGGVIDRVGAGGGILGPIIGSRDATGGHGCCWGTTIGAGPIGTPTSPTPIPMPLLGDVVEMEGENEAVDGASRCSSVRGRFGAGRPLLLLVLVLPRLRPFPSPSSLRSSSLSSSTPFASSSFPLRLRLPSRSSI